MHCDLAFWGVACDHLVEKQLEMLLLIEVTLCDLGLCRCHYLRDGHTGPGWVVCLVSELPLQVYI